MFASWRGSVPKGCKRTRKVGALRSAIGDINRDGTTNQPMSKPTLDQSHHKALATCAALARASVTANCTSFNPRPTSNPATWNYRRLARREPDAMSGAYRRRSIRRGRGTIIPPATLVRAPVFSKRNIYRHFDSARHNGKEKNEANARFAAASPALVEALP
jgi:hypothetical protein